MAANCLDKTTEQMLVRVVLMEPVSVRVDFVSCI